jgi:dihydroorotate dehydrogenase
VYDTFAMKTLLSLLFIIFSIIGIADSGFISYENISGVVPPCGVGFDCGAVLNSEWASIGPIPLAYIGFFYYVFIFCLAILNFTDFDLQIVSKKLADKINLSTKNVLRNITTQELLLIVTTFGLLFSLYLIFVMAVLIGEWCKYCLISAFTSTTLFLVSSLYFKLVEKNSPFIFKYLLFNFFRIGYIHIVKPLFFLIDAEKAHHSCTQFGKFIGSFPLTRWKTKIAFSFTHSSNVKILDGIEYPNQIGLSAGFDYNGELSGILPELGMGWHTIGTVTLHPYQGNKKPRLGRFLDSKSLLVNKGLKSLGAKVIAKNLSGIKFRIPTGISIASTNTNFNSDKEQILDILQTFYIFEKSNVEHKFYELNISCPNTFGGEPFSSPNRLKILLKSLEKLQTKLNVKKPIYIKMPIDQGKKETLIMLNIINNFTIAGVIFGNLTKDKTNPDVTKSDAKKWKTVKGNLSGKPTWNRSNELVKLTRRNYGNRFTIIGTGGIFTGEDAVAKINMGADLIQVITGMIFIGPQTIGEMNLRLAQKKLS